MSSRSTAETATGEFSCDPNFCLRYLGNLITTLERDLITLNKSFIASHSDSQQIIIQLLLLKNSQEKTAHADRLAHNEILRSLLKELTRKSKQRHSSKHNQKPPPQPPQA